MKLRDLTPDDWDGIRQYVIYVRNALGLSQWTIHISHKPASKEAQASISPIYGRKHAILFLSRHWPTTDRAEQRHTIIHEMLHLLFFDMQAVLHRMQDVMDEDLFFVMWEAHAEALEFTVDHLADILSAHFDEPPIIHEQEQLAS